MPQMKKEEMLVCNDIQRSLRSFLILGGFVTLQTSDYVSETFFG